MSMSNGPSIDHIAISMAPMSEAGHDADPVIGGNAEDLCGSARCASFSLALPGLER